MTPDWNLIRLILLDADLGVDDDRNMPWAAGFTSAEIVQHIEYCERSGLLWIPDEGGEAFEPGFEVRTKVTEKGRTWLESNQTRVS